LFRIASLIFILFLLTHESSNFLFEALLIFSLFILPSIAFDLFILFLLVISLVCSTLINFQLVHSSFISLHLFPSTFSLWLLALY
jgi:hypothetical protein